MLKVFSESISDSSSKTWKCPIRCFKQKCESFFRERLLFLDKLHFFLRKMMQTRQGIIEAEVSRLLILRWNWITEKPLSKLRMILMLTAFLDKLHFFLRKMMQTRNYWNRSEQTGNFTPWNWITEKPSKLRMILMLAASLDNFLQNHTRLNMFILMRTFHWLFKSNEGVCTLRSFPRGFELYLLT